MSPQDCPECYPVRSRGIGELCGYHKDMAATRGACDSEVNRRNNGLFNGAMGGEAGGDNNRAWCNFFHRRKRDAKGRDGTM